MGMSGGGEGRGEGALISFCLTRYCFSIFIYSKCFVFWWRCVSLINRRRQLVLHVLHIDLNRNVENWLLCVYEICTIFNVRWLVDNIKYNIIFLRKTKQRVFKWSTKISLLTINWNTYRKPQRWNYRAMKTVFYLKCSYSHIIIIVSILYETFIIFSVFYLNKLLIYQCPGRSFIKWILT